MVSIIVPVYNAAKYIEDTIAMVCNQTYKDWELILVDDASRDGSADLIEECIKEQGKRIKLIRKEVNEGAAAARNTGIDASIGRYIAFLDADDVWEMDKLEKQIAFMEKTGAAFSFHSYEFGDEKARPTGKIVHAPATLNFRQALSRTVIFTSTVMFDTENIDMEIIHMPMVPSEDTATWWRILKSGITAYGLDENLTIYRRPPKSLSSNKLIAMERIWFLYRNIANLSVLESLFYFGGWAVRATLRRL
ncbi:MULTISPECIES: glycosyltransferase family 2 protein [unclassified Butyrivibrio]|uniref:glycosyltransferase family 2 protein n=1 Tax=unclassified Butyrivibrio TaxID=2639466 RepID=UPI0008EF113F|nr:MULTISPECIES: glycosyltransferase family 2 protein [unclassified Butyrivibrio]RKM54242.1 glycosyltransferase family 2 protein [Butyrivibrio sp. X503]SFU68125.1 teichuronic acid biosynthesis glycosyltransferase TuaG [Butyrivibrio sp. INlla21]